MKLINSKQLSTMLGCSMRTIWRMVENNEIHKPYYVRSSPRWDIEAIQSSLILHTKAHKQRSISREVTPRRLT